MALGARGAQIIWLFVRRALWQLMLGLTLGLGGAVALGRSVRTLLIHTPATDPLALSVVSALLVAVAVVATMWPARRAAMVDPVTALRHD